MIQKPRLLDLAVNMIMSNRCNQHSALLFSHLTYARTKDLIMLL